MTENSVGVLVTISRYVEFIKLIVRKIHKFTHLNWDVNLGWNVKKECRRHVIRRACCQPVANMDMADMVCGQYGRGRYGLWPISMSFLAMIWLSSAVYRTYSSGPSSEPCGTPNSTSSTDDSQLQYTTCCVWSVRNKRIQSSTVSFRLNTSSRCSRMALLTQSNAAERSSGPSNVTSLTSAHQTR